ncbi:MAG: hypothetical protein ACK5NC_11275 [Vibrio sp.]
MNRDNQEFKLEYSYWIEKMHATFWGRVDTANNIALIILGCAVVATWEINEIIGLLVAIISAINVVIQPVKKSMIAKEQAFKFSRIITQLDTLSDAELCERMEAIADNNCDVVGMIEPLAFNRAAIVLDLVPTQKYSLLNKLAGHFIGDLPDNKND